MQEEWSKYYNGKFIDRDEYLVNECVGKKVLHIGCADSPFTENKYRNGTSLQQKLAIKSEYVVGLDIDDDALQICKKYSKNNNEMYLNQKEFEVEAKKYKFDTIIAGDVIEHVNSPIEFLKYLIDLSEQYNSTLIITTINATAIKPALRGLFYREAVHPDHNCYFSCGTIRGLMKKLNATQKQEYIFFNYKSNLSIFFKLLSKISPLTSDGLGIKIYQKL
jgi:2-polyprenyl-3-methyl-5-hydroxy-6-metoxy-1,4-benzoquinol methylase